MIKLGPLYPKRKEMLIETIDSLLQNGELDEIRLFLNSYSVTDIKDIVANSKLKYKILNVSSFLIKSFISFDEFKNDESKNDDFMGNDVYEPMDTNNLNSLIKILSVSNKDHETICKPQNSKDNVFGYIAKHITHWHGIQKMFIDNIDKIYQHYALQEQNKTTVFSTHFCRKNAKKPNLFNFFRKKTNF